MTYTPSNKKSAINIVLFILSAILIVGILALVVLYNGIVNLEHGIVDMRSGLKTLQAENAGLHEQALGLFDESNFQDIIHTNLVIEKSPDYFETEPISKWPLASQY